MTKEKENKNAEISARIAEVMQYTGDTRNGFAVKLGYERAQTVYDIINMKSAPSYDFFRRFSISEYSDIFNLKWLLTGNGPMLRADDAPSTPSFPLTDTTSTSDAVILRLMDKLDKKDAQIEHLQSELSIVKEELATLKAKYDAVLTNSEVLGRAKSASTRKHSSVPYQPATSAHVLSEDSDWIEVK